MSRRRLGLCLMTVLAVAICSVALDSASARRSHRHRVAHRGPHTFVFGSPDTATLTANLGKVGGFTGDGGIAGATTADPYEHPGYGYYVDGGRGPGYYYSD